MRIVADVVSDRHAHAQATDQWIEDIVVTIGPPLSEQPVIRRGRPATQGELLEVTRKEFNKLEKLVGANG